MNTVFFAYDFNERPKHTIFVQQNNRTWLLFAIRERKKYDIVAVGRAPALQLYLLFHNSRCSCSSKLDWLAGWLVFTPLESYFARRVSQSRIHRAFPFFKDGRILNLLHWRSRLLYLRNCGEQ